MELLYSNILTAVLLFLAGLWLKNYLPSYFNEKGKLLAQKEDIENITKKIEGVRNEFTKETEHLKVDLQRILNLEVSHRTEERNSIIIFYDKYNHWLYSLLEINYGAYNRGSVKELNEKRIFLEKFYAETNIAQAKLKLLVKDKEIIELSHSLIISILLFKAWVDVRLLKLEQNLDRHNSLTDRFILLMKNYDTFKKEADEMAKDEPKIEEERKKLVDEFYANKADEFKKIIPIDKKFTDLVKAYLTT